MVQRRSLPVIDRGRALAWFRDGVALREVARRLQVSPSVICRLRQRWQATGRVQDRPRPGKPRKTTRREDRYVTRQAQMSRTRTAKQIRAQLRAATHTNVSVQTIRNRLHEAQLHARRPARRPKLTRDHKRARLAWSRRHLRWTLVEWSRVLFSDESRFCLEHPDRRTRVWRRRGERFNQDCIQPAHGGGSVMVWAGFSAHHRTPLHPIQGNLNAQRYRDEILQPHALPTLRRVGPQAVLQDDNARPHRARLVDAFLRHSGVTRMDWPACSPDMNPIENAWDYLERQVRDNHPPPQNPQQLLNLLQQEWQAIPAVYFRNLVNSMRRRLVECERVRGGYTHY